MEDGGDLLVGLEQQSLILNGDLLQLPGLGLGDKDVAVLVTDLLSALRVMLSSWVLILVKTSTFLWVLVQPLVLGGGLTTFFVSW